MELKELIVSLREKLYESRRRHRTYIYLYEDVLYEILGYLESLLDEIEASNNQKK